MRHLAEEYWGGHRPPEDEATLDDMGDWGGGDVYEHPEFYSHTGGGEPWEKESFRVLRAARGKPNQMVTIYRALPPGHTTIQPGDWVALSRGYCAQHSMQDDDSANDWPIIAAQVPAHTVRNGGNDVIEWGYWGPPVSARLASLSAEASEKHAEHAMIALRPSEEALKAFAAMPECTEAIEDLHITLYYLGEIEEDCGGEHGKERIYRGLYDFALHAGYRSLTGKANGLGVFQNEQNTLITLWDIPGIAEFRTHLMRYVKAHQGESRVRTDDHGFTPHMSLATTSDSIKTLPNLPRGNPEEVHFTSVWLVWGEEWTEVTLS